MNADISIKELEEILNNYRSSLSEVRALYDRYRGNVDIYDRVLSDRTMVQMNLANDFRGMIVDQAVSYLFSVPITYRMRDIEDSEGNKRIQDFLTKNDFHSKDMLQGKLAAICGYSGRLLYVNKKGEEAFEIINPWECIWVSDHSGNTEIAIRWYSYQNTKNETEEYAEIYDTEKTVFYKKTTGSFQKTGEIPHWFGVIPLIRFENTPDIMSDFSKVENLVDFYDVILSSASEELEETRLALLTISGANLDENELDKAKGNGFGALNLGSDSKASWLLKDLPHEYLDKVLGYIERNIFRFSSSVDFTSEKFGSGNNQSGVAIRYQLLGFENKAGLKENSFKQGLFEFFTALSNSYKKRGIELKPEDVNISFNRNLPIDLEHAGEIFNQFWGKLPNETVLSLMSFIPDPAQESKKIENKENELNDILINKSTL